MRAGLGLSGLSSDSWWDLRLQGERASDSGFSWCSVYSLKMEERDAFES